MSNLGHISRRIAQLLMGRKAYKWILRDWLSLHDIRSAREIIASMRHFRQIQPQELAGPSGSKLLVLAPHPDDEVIGPGGTLIKAVERGKTVRVLYLTSGKKDEAERRETEAKEVASICGFETEFAHGVAEHIEIKTASAAIANAALWSPSAIFVPFVLDDHDDHRRSNEALIAAYDEGKIKRSVEVWAYQVYSVLPGNIVVDITAVAEQKKSAIRAYHSQMRSRDWADLDCQLNCEYRHQLLLVSATQVQTRLIAMLPDNEIVM